MKITDTIETVLRQKAFNKILEISPDQTVREALALMAEYDVGALMVLDGGRLVGILSERDYARKVILKHRSSSDTTVAEIMSAPPVTVAPDDTVRRCMELMTEGRFRHLPVVQGGRVVGMLSIGDLVKAVIEDQRDQIEQLERYIAG